MKLSRIGSEAERVLDEAIELTFPASDPISVDHAFDSARRREAEGAPQLQNFQHNETG